MLSGALLLPGCAPAASDSSGSSSSPAATARPTSSETSSATSPARPPEPALLPDGTAQDNLTFFASVVQAVWGTPQQVSGRAYIDALVAAGFDKGAMQVTPDASTVGNPAESIQFSVRWSDQCLIGQVGPATGAPVAVVVPVLAEGTCLVGQTRPIDW